MKHSTYTKVYYSENSELCIEVSYLVFKLIVKNDKIAEIFMN